MINDSLEKLYDEQGINPKFFIEKQLELLNKAFEKDDLTNANKVLESFKESLSMNPPKIKRYESFGLQLKGTSNLQENFLKAKEQSDRKELLSNQVEGS